MLNIDKNPKDSEDWGRKEYLIEALNLDPRVQEILNLARSYTKDNFYRHANAYIFLKGEITGGVGWNALNPILRTQEHYHAVLAEIDKLLPLDDIDEPGTGSNKKPPLLTYKALIRARYRDENGDTAVVQKIVKVKAYGEFDAKYQFENYPKEQSSQEDWDVSGIQLDTNE